MTHKSEAIIQCQFDINNIPASIKKLQNAVNANNKIALDESYHSGKFAVYFIMITVIITAKARVVRQ